MKEECQIDPLEKTAFKKPVFSPNTGKYGPKITAYFDTFHPVINFQNYQHTFFSLNYTFTFNY